MQYSQVIQRDLDHGNASLYRRGMATKLEKLLEKEAQLKAQIQLAKATERTQERKRDTRRKILIGAAAAIAPRPLRRPEKGGPATGDHTP